VFIAVGTLNVTAINLTCFREDGGTGSSKTWSLFVTQHGVTLRKINRYIERRENPKYRIVIIA
jgi:hypothetical protein